MLTRADLHPNITNMSALVDQISALHAAGHEVVLVSSGAVACGRGTVKPRKNLDEVSARQLFSSVGQIKLINLYDRLFSEYGITIGQVLTQKENFGSRTAYLNQRECMLTMLANGVVPVVNENDTASLTELMFTDNDELSGLVATMIDADMLVILSNVDGIYTAAPDEPGAELIPSIPSGSDLSAYISERKSGFGRGGMGTKCGTALKVAAEGIAVVIANGFRPGILTDIIANPSQAPHTRFEPAQRELSTVKRWIAHSGSFAKGKVKVNLNAARILLSDRAVSLLPVGVTATEGNWEEGDIISVEDPAGRIIAVGKASVSSEKVNQTAGKRDESPVIHYDYLYILI